MRAAYFLLAIWVAVANPKLAHSDTPCPVPEDLVLRDLALPAAKQAVVRDHRLVVLTLGGASTAGLAAGDPGATYPARLQAELTAALPGITVNVANEAVPRNTTTAVPPAVPGLIAKTGAKLVLWAPGGRDAVRRSDPSEFFVAVQAGIDAVRHAGADLILLDLQYVPSLEQMTRIEDYRDTLRGAASANDVPLLARHEMMRAWSEDGTLNLDATDKSEQTQVARRLFSCVAQTLAASIAEAVR